MNLIFNILQYAKAQLLLAQNRNDAAEIEQWQQLVAYWQSAYNAQKQCNLLA